MHRGAGATRARKRDAAARGGIHSRTAVKMNYRRVTPMMFAGVLALGALAAVPVWAQVVPVVEGASVPAGASVVAVLPFENISGQPQDDWLGAGIADTVLADFATRDAVVIGPAAMLAEARRDGTDLNVERNAIALSRRLGAAWLVTGGYQLLGDQIRITARVVDVRTGVAVSTVKVDGRREDLFTLQDRIVAELARSTPLALSTGGATDGHSAAAVAGPTPTRSPSSVAAAAPNRPSGPTLTTPGVPVAFEGPPAPVPPAVVARDAQGRVTVRAVRLTTELTIDGRLDEEIYETAPSFSDFIEQEPDEGEIATEKTEVWIFFDDQNVYFIARMFMSQPDRLRADSMRRDSTNLIKNDFFSVTLDTLFDHRSGTFFLTNALGGQRDALLSDEHRGANFDYNPIWDVKSQRFDQGWATEISIPFKSLRYVQRREQVWNVVLMRMDQWKNEISYLTPMPRSAGWVAGFRLSSGATIVGIEAPPPALNLEIKPYVTGNATTLPSGSGFRTSSDQDVGVDIKYGLTKTLAADFTYNTDFAQADVDDQQINLTRFSLFFPEKREFFLEGQGLFQFGGVNARGRGGAGQAPIMFFSRQIGLHNGQAVPIQAGGRLMGKAGAYNVGVLSIRTDKISSPSSAALVPATRFSVMRVKRDILRRSSIGIIATERTPAGSANANNLVLGADIALNLFTNVEAVSYYARSRTPGATGDEESYRGRFFYDGDKYGLDVDHLKVGDAFNPEIGFLARRDFRRTYALARFSPRPPIPGVRQLTWDARLDYIEGARHANLQTRTKTGTFRIDFESGDFLTAEFERTEDRPERAFGLPGDVTIQAGVYEYDQTTLTYSLGNTRRITGLLSVNTGSFYDGNQDTVSYTGRITLTPQLAVEPRVSVTRLTFAQQRITTGVLSARTTFSMTPRMFVTAFLQYNSAAHVVGLNTRFRWEYRPGSDFFVVYSEGRETAVAGFPGLSNRQVVAKFTRLFRF